MTTTAPPLPGLLYAQAGQYLSALGAMEGQALAGMTGAWLDAQAATWRDLEALLERVATARAAGKRVSPAWAYQEARLRALIATTQEQVARYASVAAAHALALQEQAVMAGVQGAGSLTSAAVAQAGIAASFVQVNPDNMRHLVGFLQDGTPLADLFATLAPAATQDIRDAFIQGIIAGRGIDRLRADLRRVLDVPRWRAETIARTEAHRVFREASRQTYAANADVLEGWVWTAHLDARTCPACVAMHGTVLPVTETLDGHPRCRCAMVPRTRSWADLGVDAEGAPLPDTRPPILKGTDWLKGQSPRVQRAVLGPGKYAAWQDGTLDLDDIVTRTSDPRWGTMRREATLAEAKAATAARQTAQQAPVRSMASILDDRDAEALQGIYDAALGRALEGTGLVATRPRVSVRPSGASVSYNLAAADQPGKMLGSITRQFTRDRAGRVVVENEYFTLPPSHQGKGIASRLAQDLEATYKDAGVDRIELHANIDVGGYTWARQGFGWTRRYEAGELDVLDCLDALAAAGGDAETLTRWRAVVETRPVEEWPTPWDLSRLGWSEGATDWAGKRGMLGTQWYGEKVL